MTLSPERLATTIAAHAADRKSAELEPRGTARILARLLVRRDRHRHQHDAIELELVVRLLRHDEMTHVRRIERAAEDADVTHG